MRRGSDVSADDFSGSSDSEDNVSSTQNGNGRNSGQVGEEFKEASVYNEETNELYVYEFKEEQTDKGCGVRIQKICVTSGKLVTSVIAATPAALLTMLAGLGVKNMGAIKSWSDAEKIISQSSGFVKATGISIGLDSFVVNSIMNYVYLPPAMMSTYQLWCAAMQKLSAQLCIGEENQERLASILSGGFFMGPLFGVDHKAAAGKAQWYEMVTLLGGVTSGVPYGAMASSASGFGGKSLQSAAFAANLAAYTATRKNGLDGVAKRLFDRRRQAITNSVLSKLNCLVEKSSDIEEGESTKRAPIRKRGKGRNETPDTKEAAMKLAVNDFLVNLYEDEEEGRSEFKENASLKLLYQISEIVGYIAAFIVAIGIFPGVAQDVPHGVEDLANDTKLFNKNFTDLGAEFLRVFALPTSFFYGRSVLQILERLIETGRRSTGAWKEGNYGNLAKLLLGTIINTIANVFTGGGLEEVVRSAENNDRLDIFGVSIKKDTPQGDAFDWLGWVGASLVNWKGCQDLLLDKLDRINWETDDKIQPRSLNLELVRRLVRQHPEWVNTERLSREAGELRDKGACWGFCSPKQHASSALLLDGEKSSIYGVNESEEEESVTLKKDWSCNLY